MKTVDLHVHSTYSDGTLTPKELVLRAKQFGLSAFALTDHDTVAGIDEAVMEGNHQSIEVIPGIELSTFFDQKEIHIVGLYVDSKNQSFLDALQDMQNARINRNIEMCKKFRDIGINISYDEMVDKYSDCVITRAHFADFLLEKGFIKNRNEAFERYIGDRGPCYVPRTKVSTEAAVALIRKAGGVPILAHPVLYHLGKAQMRNLLTHLCQAGLVGIETVYSTYSTGEEIEIRSLAKEFHLLESGGSDYHGANKPKIEIGIGYGHLCVPYDFLDAIRAYRKEHILASTK